MSTKIEAPEGVPQIVITREFDAPRDLVFRAHTDPDLLKRWLGPRRLRMTVERMELRDGGRWQFTHYDGDNTHVFHGVHHGTPSPDSYVRTFEYAGASGHVSLETATFTEQDGRTTVRAVSAFQSVQDRDAAIASGMESGVVEGYQRLDELLATHPS